MTELSNTSRVVADDLRKAEKSIEVAQRDLLQFMLTATEANMSLGYSPAMTQSILAPAVVALQSLSTSQAELSGRAHGEALRLARRLKLTERDFGGGDPKPAPMFLKQGDAVPQDIVPQPVG